MPAPTLLRTDSGRSIPYHVIEDLQLHRIFSEHASHMLTHPCAADVILLRRELFSLLGGEAREPFAAFHRALAELSRINAIYKKLPESASKYFVLASLEAKYAAAIRMIPRLRGCTLTDELADYWEDGDRAVDAIEDALRRAEPHLTAMSRATLSFHEKSFIMPDVEGEAYIETIEKCAYALGLLPEGARSRAHREALPIGEATDAPFRALFAEPLDALRLVLPPYKSLELGALLSLAPEAAFCLEICEFIDKMTARGLPLCYPRVSSSRRYIARGACDFTLTYKKIDAIVPNDIEFGSPESFFFLLGANGGGKTTYLRCVGANLLLFLSGAPICARDAEIYPFPTVLTHFPADERVTDVGRLDDERRRADAMLAAAGPDSFLIFNETYSGTDDKYGCELTLDTARALTEHGAFGIYVTHFHELLSHGEFGFLEAVIDAENGNARTYKIVRQNARRGSYAADILKKYGLDRASLERRDKK